MAVFAGERHAALTQVRTALTGFHLSGRLRRADRAPSVEHLAQRLRQAWHVRHTSPDHRTQLGALLPGLIRDAQNAAHAESGRRTREILAGVYQLTDFYVAYQPAPELVWLVADRAIHAGFESDDPYVIACSAWAMVQALRDSGRWEEAIELATDSIARLTPYLDRDGTPDDWRGIVGALEAEIAYVHARRGRHGEAWQYWERAHRAADTLGPRYRHVQTSFSAPVMTAHAVTLGVELRRPGEALQAAQAFDADRITSIPRRSRHLIEVARAHDDRDESAAAFAMLARSERTAPETIAYNGYARDMLRGMLKSPPPGMRAEVRELSHRVGVAAA